EKLNTLSDLFLDGQRAKRNAADQEDNQNGDAQREIEELALERLAQGVLEDGQVFHRLRAYPVLDSRVLRSGRSRPSSASLRVCMKISSNVCRCSTRWRTPRPRERNRSTTGSMLCPSFRPISQKSPVGVALYPSLANSSRGRVCPAASPTTNQPRCCV